LEYVLPSQPQTGLYIWIHTASAFILLLSIQSAWFRADVQPEINNRKRKYFMPVSILKWKKFFNRIRHSKKAGFPGD